MEEEDLALEEQALELQIKELMEEQELLAMLQVLVVEQVELVEMLLELEQSVEE